MSDALEEHDKKASKGGRNITNLQFADDTDALAEEEQEKEAIKESLDKTCTRYKIEIRAEKTKLMTNSAISIHREIQVKGHKLGNVRSFKYLGAVVSDDDSKVETLSRIAQATAALTRLKPIWKDNNISLGSKVKLMRSLIISIILYASESLALTAEVDKRTQAFEMRCYLRLPNISYKDHVNSISLASKVKLMRSLVISIFLHANESLALTAELDKRTQAFEMRCYLRLLNISYKDHVTNEEVRRKIQAAIGEYDDLLTLVKKRKLRWFGYVSGLLV